MKKWLAIILVTTSLKICLAQEYLWPTDASNHLTSSFAESRPRRFHMGIDVKTWGQSGYQAIATRAGFVARMRISPFGYGRALYIRLDTGETAVYAHLERFNDRLQALAEREQKKKNEYRIDKYFKAGAVPVKQGEVIAFTGETGIGVPHLHFEIRDTYNRPTNPLHKGMPIKDTIKPVVTKIIVSPLEPGAMIDGDYLSQSYRLSRAGSKYIIKAPIHISGKVGFSVGAYDRANGVNNRFAPYRYRLYIDDHLQFESKFDRLSFNENKLIQLAQDFYLARQGWGRLYNLYQKETNSLKIYSNLNSAQGALFVSRHKQTEHSAAFNNELFTSFDAGRNLSWGEA